MPNVSVVVPIYNAGKKLDKCIRSILNQTYKEFELILVNDGSSDNSMSICKKYQNKDNRIILINKKNEGCIAARKRGVETSTSKYVMFVDADDWIARETIETLYNEAVENDVEITVCNTYKVVGNGRLFRSENKSHYFNEGKTFNKEEIYRDLVVAYFHGHPFPSSLCAKLYKKELLQSSGKYLDRISFLGEDLFYNLEMFLKANKVKIIDKPLYYYRAGGFTSKYMPYLFKDMVNGYQIQKEVIDEHYQDTRNKQYNGISIMLLNTFKTCLYNLFNGTYNENEVKQLIREYVEDNCVIECLNNDGSRRYFPTEYLNAIDNKDINYLFDIGKQVYKKRMPKKLFMNIALKIPFI